MCVFLQILKHTANNVYNTCFAGPLLGVFCNNGVFNRRNERQLSHRELRLGTGIPVTARAIHIYPLLLLIFIDNRYNSFGICLFNAHRYCRCMFDGVT